MVACPDHHSSWLLFSYFNAFFYRFYLVGTTRRRFPKLEHLFTIVLSMILAVSTYLFAGYLATTIAKQAP
jgi:hypothetical protein